MARSAGDGEGDAARAHLSLLPVAENRPRDNGEGRSNTTMLSSHMVAPISDGFVAWNA
jgi:hypothetical protein